MAAIFPGSGVTAGPGGFRVTPGGLRVTSVVRVLGRPPVLPRLRVAAATANPGLLYVVVRIRLDAVVSRFRVTATGGGQGLLPVPALLPVLPEVGISAAVSVGRGLPAVLD